MVQSKPKILKILIFVELVFCNNFKCEVNELHKMDPSKLRFWRSWFYINSLIIIMANVDFIKNVKNYRDQELKRSIFQNLDNLSYIKWYISIIHVLKVIKPVDFHHFGKEYKCKSHWDHRICIRIFPCSLASSCYLYSHLNCLSPCQHQKIWQVQRRFGIGQGQPQ